MARSGRPDGADAAGAAADGGARDYLVDGKLTGGFALWAALFDRQSTRWRWWMAGSLVGLMPLLPWLAHLAGGTHEPLPNIPTDVLLTLLLGMLGLGAVGAMGAV